jgi:hypothetical protein
MMYGVERRPDVGDAAAVEPVCAPGRVRRKWTRCATRPATIGRDARTAVRVAIGDPERGSQVRRIARSVRSGRDPGRGHRSALPDRVPERGHGRAAGPQRPVCAPQRATPALSASPTTTGSDRMSCDSQRWGRRHLPLPGSLCKAPRTACLRARWLTKVASGEISALDVIAACAQGGSGT